MWSVAVAQTSAWKPPPKKQVKLKTSVTTHLRKKELIIKSTVMMLQKLIRPQCISRSNFWEIKTFHTSSRDSPHTLGEQKIWSDVLTRSQAQSADWQKVTAHLLGTLCLFGSKTTPSSSKLLRWMDSLKRKFTAGQASIMFNLSKWDPRYLPSPATAILKPC